MSSYGRSLFWMCPHTTEKFLDEIGADRRNTLRKYGFSIRGKPAQKHSLLVRGEHVSGITLISVNGLLDVDVVKGSVDGDKFYDFVQKHLLPHLMPFNGVNPHSVVILDNCSIHHVDGIASMIEEVGALVHFLPPYSPDFNPIEETFSKVKAEMKNLEVSMAELMLWISKPLSSVHLLQLHLMTAKGGL